jgi:hypothetical protein
MPTTARIPGFVSQHKFAKYMKNYRNNDYADETVIDPVSKELFNSGKEKGRKGEYLVAGMFTDMGYETKVLSGHDGCDVMVNIHDKWLRVEVKTSLLKRRKYGFHRIKLTHFDLIALVFVAKDCTSVQIGGIKAKKFISTWATWVHRDTAYSMGFNNNRKHSKVREDDVWFEFTKKNLIKII